MSDKEPGQVAWETRAPDGDPWQTLLPHVKETYAAVEAAVIEECAKLLDDRAKRLAVIVRDHENLDQPHTIAEAWGYALDEATELAAALRALAKPNLNNNL